MLGRHLGTIKVLTRVPDYQPLTSSCLLRPP
jgi:hypothetical protein